MFFRLAWWGWGGGTCPGQAVKADETAGRRCSHSNRRAAAAKAAMRVRFFHPARSRWGDIDLPRARHQAHRLGHVASVRPPARSGLRPLFFSWPGSRQSKASPLPPGRSGPFGRLASIRSWSARLVTRLDRARSAGGGVPSAFITGQPVGAELGRAEADAISCVQLQMSSGNLRHPHRSSAAFIGNHRQRDLGHATARTAPGRGPMSRLTLRRRFRQDHEAEYGPAAARRLSLRSSKRPRI